MPVWPTTVLIVILDGFLFAVFSQPLYEGEERLIKMLLEKATHPDVLPMTDGPVKVKFGLTLNQIVDVVRIFNINHGQATIVYESAYRKVI